MKILANSKPPKIWLDEFYDPRHWSYKWKYDIIKINELYRRGLTPRDAGGTYYDYYLDGHPELRIDKYENTTT